VVVEPVWTPPGAAVALELDLCDHAGTCSSNTAGPSALDAAGAHVCFTDRRDEQRIDGAWQEASHPPAYRECTGLLLYFGRSNPRNCSLGADGEPVARRHQEFHATSCMLPPMDVQDFAQVIGHGATLWFLGDSVTGQMARSLVCTMRAGGFTIEEIDTGKSMPCIIMTHPQSSRGARVCFKGGKKTANLFPKSYCA
jgi:hypothetical protein